MRFWIILIWIAATCGACGDSGKNGLSVSGNDGATTVVDSSLGGDRDAATDSGAEGDAGSGIYNVSDADSATNSDAKGNADSEIFRNSDMDGDAGPDANTGTNTIVDADTKNKTDADQDANTETGEEQFEAVPGLNSPLFRHIFTADPAAIVHGDRLYIYTGRDEAPLGEENYRMYEWHVFSTSNMADWTDHGAVLRPGDFSWGVSDAWAGHVVERNGKFYWYVPINHRTINGFAIGVAVSNSPTGPFTDARGSAIITNDMTTNINTTFDDIDPAVFVDDDGQAYLYWGNTSLKAIRLQDNMIDTDGEIVYIDVPNFTEAPYMNKVNGTYYLTYAHGWPETIVYTTSNSPLGPFSRPRILNGVLPSETNHQSIVQFNDNWYFIYHNAALLGGSPHHRSVTADMLYFEIDGSIREIERTEGGVLAIGPGPVTENTDYRIISRLSGKALIPGGEGEAAALVQQTETGAATEKWRFKRVGSGTYRIYNAASGFCVDVANGSVQGLAEILQTTCIDEARQYFRLVGTGDGYFAIVNYASGKVLDVLDFSTADGASIIQWDYLYNENQQWELIE